MRRRSKFSKNNKKDSNKDFRANEKIKSPEVLLVDENGESQGVMKTEEALSLAREADLDLVEVNPRANPPVVKILDLGQFKYEQDKKIHKQKVLQKRIELKNIKLSLRISKHDLGIREEQAFKFLSKGNKIKIDLLLRGRERQHFDKAREIITDFINSLKAREELRIEEEQPLTKQPGGFTIILVNKK